MTKGDSGRKLVHGLCWMGKTAMGRYPTSLIEFQAEFGTEAACAAYLVELRWPNGFVCPACGSLRAWTLKTKAHTFECAECGRQTSVRAGTILHDSKLALTTWFLAAFLIATHSNGLSARQLQRMLGLGSYRTAWMLAGKMRRAMVDPQRAPLSGLIEADESTLPLGTQEDPPAGGGGRSLEAKMAIAGAVEISDGVVGRLRLQAIDDYSAETLHAFLTGATARRAAKSRPTAGRATPTPPAWSMIRMSSARWRRTSSCRRSTRSSATSRAGPRAFITACGARICRPVSTSSFSGSIAGTRRLPPSGQSSGSPHLSSRCPTTC